MDISWLLTAAIVVLVTYLLYKYFSKKQGYWEKRGVPFVKGSNLSIIHMFFPKKSTIDMVMDTHKQFDGEKFYGSTILSAPILVIRDPELINFVLIKDFTHFEDRNLPLNEKLELQNAGLANMTGDKWRLLRHKLMPTFTTGKMKMMHEQIKVCGDDMVEFIKSKNGNDLETKNLSFKFMINVIGNIAFGINAYAFNEGGNDFLKMSESIFKPSLLTQIKLILLIAAPKLKDFFKITFGKNNVSEFFLKFAQDLIKYRKQNKERRNDFLQLMIDEQEKELALANSMANSEMENNIHITDNDDILKHVEEPEDLELLEHLKNLKYDKNALVFSDYIIAAQTFLFISGGSDTTATVLSFALHYLAVNKEIQKKVQQEVDGVLSMQELNYEASKNMKYLEQVLYEVLRLHTPGSIINRMCVQDYKLPGTNVTIEKGTIIQIPTYCIHRDSQYFSDPEKFDPDRFEDMNSIPKNVFFPFGGGPRMCIAMRLAMLEMKVAVASLLRTFDILHSEKTPLPLVLNKYAFPQEVVGGLWVKFQERKW